MPSLTTARPGKDDCIVALYAGQRNICTSYPDTALLRTAATSLTISSMSLIQPVVAPGSRLAAAQPAKPPEVLLRAASRAIGEFRMIRPRDRILLGLSGGKDSLSLLHVLLALRLRSPVAFSVVVATIDPCIDGYDPSFLKDYVPPLGVHFTYVRQEIVERARRTMRGDSFCSYCARMRRGALYRVAREQGCNVLALGQHLDDVAESFLMSAFHEGRLRTMRAHYVNDAGDVRVIRPFVYVRERQLADFARRAPLPAIRDNCPSCFSAPGERQYMKQLLAAEERRLPRLFPSLRQTLKPLLGEPPGEDSQPLGAHR